MCEREGNVTNMIIWPPALRCYGCTGLAFRNQGGGMLYLGVLGF